MDLYTRAYRTEESAPDIILENVEETIHRARVSGGTISDSRVACNIFKVPNYIRSCDDKAYEPTIVGMGLLHHRNGPLLSPILHNLKHHCVFYLVERRYRTLDNDTVLFGNCLAEMKSLEAQVRHCYSADRDNGYVGEEELADMMLRDGCFILFLLLREARSSRLEVVVKDGEEGKSEETNTTEENYLLELHKWEEEIIQAPRHGMLWTWKLVVYDLLKLENQIPFFVVQRLFDLLKTPADEGIDLVQLALKLFGTVNPTKAKTFIAMPSSQVHHLLHLYHSSLIPSKHESENSITSADGESASGKVTDWLIPCATELQEAGIKFRPMKAAESFLEVAFKDGVMEIPPLLVDASTTFIFRNLIAFEQCYPETETRITAYAAFMDGIIKTTKDVSLLKRNRIVLIGFGTEQAAADLFSTLCEQIHFASDRNYLRKTFNQVNEYCDSRRHKWRAVLVRNYFSNPWAAISVVAAVVLLLLTIEQALFAAVSYFHPLH